MIGVYKRIKLNLNQIQIEYVTPKFINIFIWLWAPKKRSRTMTIPQKSSSEYTERSVRSVESNHPNSLRKKYNRLWRVNPHTLKKYHPILYLAHVLGRNWLGRNPSNVWKFLGTRRLQASWNTHIVQFENIWWRT